MNFISHEINQLSILDKLESLKTYYINSLLIINIIFSFRSGSPTGADPGAESPCLLRAAYRNPICQRTNNSPLRTHKDWGKKNSIAPFNTGPVPLPDGTKQHGEPTKLPSDPRSREGTANGVGCLIWNGQTAASVSGSDLPVFP